MKQVFLGNTGKKVPAIAVGCMRLDKKSRKDMNFFIHSAIDNGAIFFDHADIYAGGQSESIFGEAFSCDSSLCREKIIIQSKCGIRNGFYDQSKDYILKSVDGILGRLKTDYLDILLIHRPDALAEPEELAEAFDVLHKGGKVKYFGVSNHKPSQIKLLKRYLNCDIVANQVQFSIPHSGMIASGLEVNMTTSGSVDHDNSLIDFCRLHDITIQTWSPFRNSNWQSGVFIGSSEYEKLNKVLDEIAEQYDTTPSVIATSWILRHPANMQVVSGTSDICRLKEIISACKINLTRQEWYSLYLAAGHILP